MPAPLRVLRDALGLGSHAFICVGNNVGGDTQQLSAAYLGSVLRDVRLSAGFGLVRASNTTPVLVLRFEAEDTDALHRIQQSLGAAIRAVRPDAVLPF